MDMLWAIDIQDYLAIVHDFAVYKVHTCPRIELSMDSRVTHG